MAGSAEVRDRLSFWRGALVELRKAYLALLEGGVQRYRIDDRELSKFDLPDLLRQIKEAERVVDGLEGELAGGGRRRAFAVVPRDW